MSRIAALVAKDVRGARFGLTLYFCLLAAQVVASMFPDSGWDAQSPAPYVVYGVLAFAGWALQFLLVCHIVQRDSAYRPGAQWGTRPFLAREMVAAKLLGIFLWIFAPLGFASQISALGLGLSAGVCSLIDPLIHLTVLAVFVLLALATSTATQALLTSLVLVIPFGWASAMLRSSTLTIASPLPIYVSYGACILPFAAIGLVSAYMRGALMRPMLGLATLVSGLFVAFPLEYEEAAGPARAAAPEELTIEIAPTRVFMDDSRVYVGRILHVPGDSSRVVFLGWRSAASVMGREVYLDGMVARGPDQPVEIGTLGPVQLTDSARSPNLGPFDRELLSAAEAARAPIELMLDYEVRSYELLGRIPVGGPRVARGEGWYLRSSDGVDGSVELNVFVNSWAKEPRVALHDRARGKMKLLSRNYTRSAYEQALWPLDTQVNRISFDVPTKNLQGMEIALLNERAEGEGHTKLNGGAIRLPTEWPPAQDDRGSRFLRRQPALFDGLR